MFSTLSLIPTLLSKSKTDSLFKNFRESSILKHRRNNANRISKGKSDEESKGKSNEESKGNFDEESKLSFDEESKLSFDEDENEDIFDQKFDIYALDYLCAEKIDQLLDNIKIVCRR